MQNDQAKLFYQIYVFFSCRLLKSEVVDLASMAYKLYFGDKVYIGNEQILRMDYAFFLPKASPLKVVFDNVTCLWGKIHYFFTGEFTYGSCMVERHWDYGQNVE